MKSISWKVVISDDNKIATIEHGIGFPVDKIETHFTIIGVLENIKEQHKAKLKSLYNKTVKGGKGVSPNLPDQEIDLSDDEDEVEEEEEDENENNEETEI